MYHKSKDSHHSGTAVVELDSTLGKLGLLVEGVPSEVDSSVTEIAGEFSLSGKILHYIQLHESDESYNLVNSLNRHGGEGGESTWDRVEGVSSRVDSSWEGDSGTGDDLSEESKLGDTSVLELYITKTVETGLVNTIKKSKWVVESKRRLGTELRLEGVKSSGGLGNLGRSESGGGGGKGGGDGKLHFDCF